MSLKTKSVSKVAMAVAVGFLGMTALAAGLVGSRAVKSSQLTTCSNNNRCKTMYMSCVKNTCKERSTYASCKQTCLDNAYDTFFSSEEKNMISVPDNNKIDNSMTLKTSVCGNNVKEYGEICDDGSETCVSDCKVKVYPTDEILYSSTLGAFKFLVTDVDGNHLSHAYVRVYESSGPQDTDKLIFYPLKKPEGVLRFEGFTDTDGFMTVPTDGFGGVTYYSDIMVEKDGYAGILVPAVIHYNFKYYMNLFGGNFVLKLTKVPLDTISQDELAPVSIRSDIKLQPYVERTNRQLIKTFVPTVRADMLKNLEKVDIKMHVVGYRNVYLGTDGTPQGFMSLAEKTVSSTETHLVLTKNNVELGKHYAFNFSLPYEGMYYSFFEFTLYYNGVPKTYYYFPKTYFAPAWLPEWVISLMDQYKYGTLPQTIYAEDTTFAVLDEDTSADMNFEEVIPGHNDVDDSRINVVFFGVGFEQTDFKDAITFVTTDDYLSLTSVHPFLGNIDLFNYWYYPDMLTPEQATWEYDGSTKVLKASKPMSDIQKIYEKKIPPGKNVIILLINDDTLAPTQKTSATSGKCQFYKGVKVSINKNIFDEYKKTKTNKNIFEDFDLGRIVLHEFGHEIGLLGEEYVASSSGLFDYMKYKQKHAFSYNPQMRPNTYYAPRDYTSECYGDLSGYLECIPSKIEYCVDVPWVDMIGDGCGVDGVVDCTIDDADFFKEVGCYSGSGQAGGSEALPDLLKPTHSSIMHLREFFNYFYDNDKHPYGLYNEKVICDDIEMYTGKACK